MANERILIEVTETGARLVKRNLEDVGKGAETAHKGVSLLKGALATLGVGFTLTEALRTVEEFNGKLTLLRALSGSSAQEMRRLGEEARRLAGETGISAASIVS